MAEENQAVGEEVTNEDVKEENVTDEAADVTAQKMEEELQNSEACEFEEEPEDSGDESQECDVPEKKGLFGKKKDKKDKKDQKIEELTDQLKRQMAEFDNFRKRTDKEKSSMYEFGAKDVIEKMLPIVDNFERGLAAVPEEEQDSPFVEGMNKIYKQMMTGLEELAVKPIEAVGQEFDPNLHNAVMHVEDEEVEENTVIEEFQKGYMYKDNVVRHSMVKVAN